MNSSGKTMLALLAGVAAGATLGILFAPDKGSETRKKLSGSAGKLTDKLRRSAKEGLNSISSLKDDVVDNLGGLKDKAREDGEFAKSKSNTYKA